MGGGAFAHADGGFDAEFVEGVHAVFYGGGFYSGVGFVDAGFDLWRTTIRLDFKGRVRGEVGDCGEVEGLLHSR